MHMRYPVFLAAFGMDNQKLKKGVHSYGKNSVHPKGCFTCRVFDEDGIEKLKAYPNVTFDEFFARKIENGSEEVAEIETTLAIEPDELGNGLYEALVNDIEDEDIISKWLNEFTPNLVKATEI
jgi:hypothetical protein